MSKKNANKKKKKHQRRQAPSDQRNEQSRKRAAEQVEEQQERSAKQEEKEQERTVGQEVKKQKRAAGQEVKEQKRATGQKVEEQAAEMQDMEEKLRFLDRVARVPAVKAVVKVIRIPVIGHLLLALVLNLFLETLSRHSIVKAFSFIGKSPVVFLYNAFIIFVTLSLVQFAKRKVFATIFVCFVWILSAFANFIVLSFRTTPFSAIDILMIRNVMTMLDKYMSKWQMVLSAIGLVLVFLLLFYLYIRLPKTQHKNNPFRASAYVFMCGFLIVTLTKVAVKTQTVSDNFGNLAYAYNDYGFAYCFSNSIIDVGISKPRNYSRDTVAEIVRGLDYDKTPVVIGSAAGGDDASVTSGAVTDGSAEKGEMRKDGAVMGNADGQAGVIAENGMAKADGEVTGNAGGAEAVDTGSAEAGSTEGAEAVDTGNAEAGNTEGAEAADDGSAEAGNTEGAETGDAEAGNTDAEDAEAGEGQEEKSDAATKQYPNIIVIQLESVFDTKYMKDFYPSEDPMPTLTELKKKYSSGLFRVPAVGAGTANTEFEVQTGMSTQFFGAGEYPFKTIMRRKTCDSMAYDLKRLGYTTTGFHNNDATFYERHVDYFHLGFENFSGMEHMYNLHYTPRGWAKDDVLDDLMAERMQMTEGRDYITTISVQPHGRYPKKYTRTLTELTCEFGGKYKGDKQKRAAWQYYINMCRETDMMVRDLVHKLEQIGEPTVLFMYGDHLPSLNLEESDLDGINLYQTEWVMWDNIGLSVEKKDFTSYQASTYIFNRLGLPGGLMQCFHNRYMGKTDEQDYLNKMEILEYDTLYGNRYVYDGEDPFPVMETNMGIRKIEVLGYEIIDDTAWIYGKGFNPFSQVFIDGKQVETRFGSYTMLRVPVEQFEGGKELYVAQAGDDHLVLSVTEPFSLDQWDASEETSEEAGAERSEEGVKEASEEAGVERSEEEAGKASEEAGVERSEEAEEASEEAGAERSEVGVKENR